MICMDGSPEITFLFKNKLELPSLFSDLPGRIWLHPFLPGLFFG